MRQIFIAGNWKMNKTLAEAKAFAEELKAKMPETEHALAVMAPFTDLPLLTVALAGAGIGVGAQNVHFEESGAYTGEISPLMLRELGVSYCIVGHSERRTYFAETDDTVNRKLLALHAAGIRPIVCVGESLEIREAGNAMSFVAGQIAAAFEGLTPEQAAETVIAYEPIWAIGTGKTATPEQAEEMCGFIRGMMEGLYDEVVAEKIIIQYGGSMKPSNAGDLLAKPNIDGGLIGGASLKVDDLLAILEAAPKQA